LFPSRVNNKCPAIMFAVSRTARVPGRIRFLTVSIRTMKGIRGAGVPWGTKCSNMWFMFLIHPNSMNVTHSGSARVSVRTRCLVLVNTYGNSPRKLFIKIMVNREMKISVFPLLFFVPVIVFISLCSLSISSLSVMMFREGISQTLVGISISPMAVLVQLMGRLIISVVGSKVENRFLIIFSLFC
jgi:hypothetical protein